jgi:2'-5' RNA ligase
MHRYTIASLVPDPIGKTIAELRRQYDVFTRQWLPPHVTLVPPFERYLTRGEISSINQLRVDVTADLGRLDAISRDQTSVLFYQLPDGSFDEARQQLLSVVPNLKPYARTDQHYHVTVVNRVPNDQLEAVKQQVGQHSVSGSFHVDRVMLYEWDDEVRRWIALTP